MALEPPEQGFVWLSVPLHESVEVTVLGEIHTWHSHWHRAPGARRPIAVRCVRDDGHVRRECEWCVACYERRARYVFPVRVETEVGDAVRLVELGRVQYPTLVALASSPLYETPWVGTRLRMGREKPHVTAPIWLRRIGHERLPEEALVDVAGVVATLGISAGRSHEPVIREPVRPEVSRGR